MIAEALGMIRQPGSRRIGPETNDAPSPNRYVLEQLEAVCVGLLQTFPEVSSEPTLLPESYVELDTGRGVLKTPNYTLRITAQCFDEDAAKIVNALSILGYSGLLRTHHRLILDRGRAPLRRMVAEWYQWHLLIGE